MNPRPDDYKSTALPTELHRLKGLAKLQTKILANWSESVQDRLEGTSPMSANEKTVPVSRCPTQFIKVCKPLNLVLMCVPRDAGQYHVSTLLRLLTAMFSEIKRIKNLLTFLMAKG